MNSLTVFRSNRLEYLGLALARTLADHPPADPMQPVEVVAASYGMEAWLRRTIAHEARVCAHVSFPFPAKVFQAAVDDVLGGRPDSDGWAPQALAWTVLEVLPPLLGEPEFEPVARHFQAEARADGAVTARQMALIEAIANVLDSYLTYRPEWVEDWSRGGRLGTENHPDLAWQPRLFAAICAHLNTPHTVERTRRAIAHLRAGPLDEEAEPLRLFGVRSLPPLWWALVDAIAHSRPVEIYLLAPSDQFWADVQKGASRLAHLDSATDAELASHLDEAAPDGHPLLANLGRSVRDQQIVLESVTGHYTGVDLFAPPAPDDASHTRLARLQADLFAARLPADRASRPSHPGDRSVEFHGCYGALRQVEALHDTLLDLLNGDPELQERDILILTPDIDTYAPLVTAVFGQGQRYPSREGWGPSGSPHLRIEVRDLSVRRLNPVADTLLRALEMASGRVHASEVYDWLGLEPVRHTFGLSEDDRDQIREWLDRSGIRWGLDADHRAEQDQPADPQNTWAFGLERLCLGAVMADDGPLWHPTKGRVVRPVDDVEGPGLLTLARFVRACRSLFTAFEALNEPRPLQQWVADLKAWIDVLATPPPSAGWMSQRVHAELDALGASPNAPTLPLDLGAIQALLTQRFDVASRLTAPDPGAITLGSITASDVLPHKVIALLGMDEGTFPRQSSDAAFDLMTRSPRVGDRRLRDEDRATLLHAMLAAREHLLVFHTHRDPHTNQAIPPCVPIAELLSTLALTVPGGADEVEACRFSHPLQSWSRRRFLASTPTEIQSFDPRLAQAAGAVPTAEDPSEPFFPGLGLEEDLRQPVTWEELVAFWSDPHAALLRRLRIPTRDGGGSVEDREPWDLDALAGWGIRNTLLNERTASNALDRIRADGLLPLGIRGHLRAEAIAMFKGVAESVKARLQTDDPFVIDVAGQELRVPSTHRIGTLAVRLTPSKFQAREVMRSWLTLLATHCHRPEITHMVTCHGNKDWDDFVYRGLETPVTAHEILTRLVTLAQSWRHGPLPYHTKASHDFAKAYLKSKQDVSPGSAGLAACFTKGRQVLEKDASGAWVRLFEPGTPMEDEGAFMDLALDIWRPILEADSTPKKAKARLEAAS